MKNRKPVTKKLYLEGVSEKILLLFSDVRKFLSEQNDEIVRDFSEKVPQSLSSEDKVSIVFVGQYSAGKTSLIECLTGKKLKTSGGICTDKCEAFEWNGLEIIDTPGIHTGLHPDHDEITYKKISEADLIIFMITSELFDETIFNHFKKLAFEDEKIHEMMLVVNKMEQCEQGNTPEAWEIKNSDLLKWLKAVSPSITLESIFTTYIDVESYRYFMKDHDLGDEVRSNIPMLIENINKFSSKRKVLGKCTTNLYSLRHLLFEVGASLKTSDENIEVTKEILKRDRVIWEEARKNARILVNDEVAKLKNDIHDRANKLSLSVGTDSYKDDVEDFNRYIDDAFKQTSESIEKELEKQNLQIADKFKTLFSSSLGKTFFSKISEQLSKLSPDVAEKIKSIADYSRKAGEFLLENAKSPKGLSTGLQSVSGSNLHTTVMKVGHIFGHKFKPWEGLKWAKVIGKAGKVLTVTGIFLGIALQIKEDRDERKRERELKSARNEIRLKSLDIVNSIETHFSKAFHEYDESVITPFLNASDQRMNEVNKFWDSKNLLINSLLKFQERTSAIIQEIHSINAEDSVVDV